MLLKPCLSDDVIFGASAVLKAMLRDLDNAGQPKRGKPDSTRPLRLLAYVKLQPCEVDRAAAAAAILDLARLLGKVVAGKQLTGSGIGETDDAA